MFGILDRYIGRSILLTSLLVLMTLVALASIFAFISELDDVGKGNYTVIGAAQYVFLTIPGKAYLLFAPAVLLGSLLGLGALASNSELTVMRAAGVSGARIISGNAPRSCEGAYSLGSTANSTTARSDPPPAPARVTRLRSSARSSQRE